jgi:hypothetical protein
MTQKIGDSVSFNSLLQQALSFGAKKVTPSRFPAFVGVIVYSALAGLIWGGFVLQVDRKLIVAGVILLLLSGVMSTLLIMGHSVYPIVLNIIVLLVVIDFLGMGAYAIMKLAEPDSLVEYDLHSNLQYKDGPWATDFVINAEGHQDSVTTGPLGYFSLLIRKSEIHKVIDEKTGKEIEVVHLHVQSPDGHAWNLSKEPNQAPLVLDRCSPNNPTACQSHLDITQESNNPANTPALTGVGPPPEGTWRFIVSGDSRNCGDIIMPAIAARSKQLDAAFYWHLGDLRAIYKVDEDIAFAAHNEGQPLSCSSYHQRAWPDFIEHQIAPFANLPFYLGIGNHEVIPPKDENAFERQFNDWLDQPTLHAQRVLDNELQTAETFYHWIQGGVDLIYLDNAQGYFSDAQLSWFQHRLEAAQLNAGVKSIVVGMHEALPDSLANSHSMGDGSNGHNGRSSGEKAYKALVAFRDASHKPVYILASHSHFFMEDIFNSPVLKQGGAKPLAGWIIGTAGAVRYPLPDIRPEAPAISRTDVYGYLLGTVSPDGTIGFSFEEVQKSDVPQYVQQQYGDADVSWCFEHNSQHLNRNAPELTPLCVAPQPSSHTH